MKKQEISTQKKEYKKIEIMIKRAKKGVENYIEKNNEDGSFLIKQKIC